MKYEFKMKPTICPVCGSNKIARYLYGLPKFSDKLRDDINTGKVVIGGCIIEGSKPKWKCVNCQTDFFKKIY